jgi:hypothetical protein
LHSAGLPAAPEYFIINPAQSQQKNCPGVF